MTSTAPGNSGAMVIIYMSSGSLPETIEPA